MLHRIKTRLTEMERRLRTSFGDDISTPAGRRAAFWHFQLMDHAALRVAWTNLHRVAPGAWRSNQPSPRRLARYRDMGIRTVINLRGADRFSPYLFEAEACRALGLTLVDRRIYPRRLAEAEEYIALLDAFDAAERPLVMHCKSGADRAGLAAAFYLMHVEGAPVAEARRQLGPRYLHFRTATTGVLDYLLDRYAEDAARHPMSIRDWLATRYDRERLSADWSARR